MSIKIAAYFTRTSKIFMLKQGWDCKHCRIKAKLQQLNITSFGSSIIINGITVCSNVLIKRFLKFQQKLIYEVIVQVDGSQILPEIVNLTCRKVNLTWIIER